MTIKTSDRVFETTTSTGTGTINLAGPVSGFRSFVDGVGGGSKVPYTITQSDSNGAVISWECGVGTVTDAATDTLARNTVLRSSNSNTPVNFGAGTKNVYLGFVADIVPTRDENLNFIEGFGPVTGSANALTLTLPVAPKGYSDGMVIRGIATNANAAGALTVNTNSLGNKNIKVNGVDPSANVLTVGQYFEAVYKSASGWYELTYPVPIASQATAEAGLNNTDIMTALRTKQAIAAYFNGNDFRGMRGLTKVTISPGTAEVIINNFVLGRNYILKTRGVYGSVNADINAQLSTNNGTSFISSASAYIYQYLTAQGTSVSASSGNPNFMLVTATGVGNAATTTGNHSMEIQDPLDPNTKTIISSLCAGNQSTASGVAVVNAGRQSQEAHNAIRLYPSSGTFQGGTIQPWEVMA